jgi:hypothetical protein
VFFNGERWGAQLRALRGYARQLSPVSTLSRHRSLGAQTEVVVAIGVLP